jgi:hypothetical protein
MTPASSQCKQPQDSETRKEHGACRQPRIKCEKKHEHNSSHGSSNNILLFNSADLAMAVKIGMLLVTYYALSRLTSKTKQRCDLFARFLLPCFKSGHSRNSAAAS